MVNELIEQLTPVLVDQLVMDKAIITSAQALRDNAKDALIVILLPLRRGVLNQATTY